MQENNLQFDLYHPELLSTLMTSQVALFAASATIHVKSSSATWFFINRVDCFNYFLPHLNLKPSAISATSVDVDLGNLFAWWRTRAVEFAKILS